MTLAELIEETRDEVQPLLRFVDTSELVDGREAHGQAWAQLFLDGDLTAFSDAYLQWRRANA